MLVSGMSCYKILIKLWQLKVKDGKFVADDLLNRGEFLHFENVSFSKISYFQPTSNDSLDFELFFSSFFF